MVTKPNKCPKCGAKEGVVVAQTYMNGRRVYHVSCYKCKNDEIVDTNDKSRPVNYTHSTE